MPSLHVPTEFHGTAYGGWAVLKDSLNQTSRVVSVGVGEDASFDLSLISKYGCAVHAFDPTPKSVDWVRQHISEPLFCFQPLALGDIDGTLRLFLPKNTSHVSASCRRNEHTKVDYFDAPCVRLTTLLDKLSLNYVDLLKIDIEGAEYGVIRDSIESGVISLINQFLVEFHHHFTGFTVAETKNAVADLAVAGLHAAWVSSSGHEVLF